MNSMNAMTLTTDFGLEDWFVGTMKGVILGIAPRATVVDLTHGVPRGDIRAGAFALAASCRYFPQGTIHTVVVDPGVGSQRAALVVRTRNYFFVGPDNGVLSFALACEEIKSIRRLESPRYFLGNMSQTFHGRDVFAPVAAHLSKGVPMLQFGPETKDYVRLPWPQLREAGGAICGEVLYLDRFGNAITNLPNNRLAPTSTVRIGLGGKRLVPVKAFYKAVPAGKPVAVLGSAGFLEIAINGGSAATKLKLKPGSRVEVVIVKG